MDRSSPVQVGTSSWTKVASGAGYGQFAIRADGGLFAWGNNNQGGLGVGDLTTRSSPVQVGTDSWTFISAGLTDSSFGIKQNNSLYSWGNNNGGLLGTTRTASTSSPTFVASIKDSWTVVSAGSSSAMAIRNDNLLFGWGLNTSGQLGTDDITNKSAPTQIGNDTWSNISAGNLFTAATRPDGSMWVWGSNSNGILGLDDIVHRSSPVQIGTYEWYSIVAGSSSIIGNDIYGVLYTWGFGNNGLQGQNDTVHRSAPVQLGQPFGYVVNPTNYATITQVGNSGWNSVSAGNNYSMAIRTGDNVLFRWGFNLGAPLLGTLTNVGYSAAQISSGTSHFGFVKKP